MNFNKSISPTYHQGIRQIFGKKSVKKKINQEGEEKKYPGNVSIPLWQISPNFPLFFLADEETFAESHQETHERLYGLLAHREEEDCGGEPRHPQCRDLQAVGQEVGEVLIQGGDVAHR